MAESPLQAELDERPVHCTLIDGRFHLVPPPERYLNHACDPNVYLRFGADGIKVVTRRALCSGAELTIDYLIHNPGGDRCRGETGKSFFCLPEGFQRDYRPLLAPWLLKRYASKRDSIAP